MTVKEYNRSVEEYADSVYRFIRADLKDEDRANDIVQDSYEKLWRHVAEIDYSVVKSFGSHTKMVFQDGHKVKANGDFSLNMLRYGATARIGYGNFQLYGTYYMTPLFQPGKGPAGYDLYPFELGVAFTFND